MFILNTKESGQISPAKSFISKNYTNEKKKKKKMKQVIWDLFVEGKFDREDMDNYQAFKICILTKLVWVILLFYILR